MSCGVKYGDCLLGHLQCALTCCSETQSAVPIGLYLARGQGRLIERDTYLPWHVDSLVLKNMGLWLPKSLI
jgi:hypothetical protein